MDLERSTVVGAWCRHLRCDSSEAWWAWWVAGEASSWSSCGWLRLWSVLGDLNGWNCVLQDDADDARLRLLWWTVLWLWCSVLRARLSTSTATASSVLASAILALFLQQNLTDLIQQLWIDGQAFLCVSTDGLLLVVSSAANGRSTVSAEWASASRWAAADRWSVVVVATRSFAVHNCGQREDRKLWRDEKVIVKFWRFYITSFFVLKLLWNEISSLS